MRVAIGLGSNLGDRRALMSSAITGLAAIGELVAVSSLYRSDPVGGPDQPDFLNAVVVIDTTYGLSEVLAACQALETAAGRVREENWGPRTLDLDILAATAAPTSTPTLTVPHARLAERRFALEPLAEVWPDAPTGKGTARGTLRTLADVGVERLVAPGWETEMNRGGWWVVGQAVIFVAVLASAFALGDRIGRTGSMPWAGRVLVVVGAVLMIWSLRSLGKNLTAFPQPLERSSLVTAGPYNLARHPIYGANVLLLLGVSVHEGSLVAVVASVVAGLFFWLKAGFEEQRLMVAHSDYGQYRRTVTKRLIPYLV